MKTTKTKTTNEKSPLRDRCLSHFAVLGIPVEAAALDELLARAEKESFSHLSFLDRRLGSEASARRERAECPQAAHLLYKIIASRNQKRSTALVTNVDFDKWGEYLSDGPLAMAFLDRLVEGAIILKVKGKSYRAEKANLAEKSPA